MAAAELQNFNIDMNSFFSKEKLINPATAIAQSRWIAATELQNASDYNKYLASAILSYKSWILSKYKILDPTTTLLQVRDTHLLKQYGYMGLGRGGGITGLDFDVYFKGYIYNTNLGGGSGLLEIYNALRKLLNGK